MPLAAIRAYQERLPRRHAELKLLLAGPAALPHMEASDRNSVLRAWERLANDHRDDEAAPPAMLALIGIRVIHVGKPG